LKIGDRNVPPALVNRIVLIQVCTTMSTDPTILLCLMKATGAESLQMFDRVNVLYNDEQCACYVCLGKHSLYFVSREMQRLSYPITLGMEMSYLDIEKAALDTKTNRRILLQLTSNRNGDWDQDKLVIRSDFRQLLIDRIAVCWQAEYMYRNFEVKRFQLGKTDDLQLNPQESLHNIDPLQIQPFVGYAANISYRGYSFFLREGFADVSRMKGGNWRHNEGWEVSYGYASNKIIVPPECCVTIHINDPISIMELEKDAEREDIRTVAANYRLALTAGFDQVYVLANQPYMKRLNRTNDMASWEGWELLIRSETCCFAVVLLRRNFIPPVCDLSQDCCVLLRCPASHNMLYDTHEVIMDECRYIADSLSPLCDISSPSQLYRTIIQARLDALQYNEDAYTWLKGYVGLDPAHLSLGVTFVKSLAVILDTEGQNFDEDLLKCEILDAVEEVVVNPMAVINTLMSDYQDYLGEAQSPESASRRVAWNQRISRYLAYAVDGGILGDRFSLSNIVLSVGKCTAENDKLLKNIIEYLLHARTSSDVGRGGGTRTPLMQLLQDPDLFASCDFNERVMRGLLVDNYIQNEWRRKASGAGTALSVHYEKLLAALLRNPKVGIGLRTLICRQILEIVNMNSASTMVEKQILVLVPALVSVMESKNVNLVSCATAALVNLSCNYMTTKTLLMQQGCMKLMIQQLKRKDDDLTLYTLYLLVNMSKTPQHRSVIVSNGGVALLVDILSSSYQNLRKRKILTELCSVIGQLCNDVTTRSLLSDDMQYPVTSCLLWIFDSTEPNTKLKSKLLFALRQLCGHMQRLDDGGRQTQHHSLVEDQNKLKIGSHVIHTVLEELGMARREFEEVAMNSVLFLIVVSSVVTNAKQISRTLHKRLQECNIMREDGQTLGNQAKFSPELIDKVAQLVKIVTEVGYGD